MWVVPYYHLSGHIAKCLFYLNFYLHTSDQISFTHVFHIQGTRKLAQIFHMLCCYLKLVSPFAFNFSNFPSNSSTFSDSWFSLITAWAVILEVDSAAVISWTLFENGDERLSGSIFFIALHLACSSWQRVLQTHLGWQAWKLRLSNSHLTREAASTHQVFPITFKW